MNAAYLGYRPADQQTDFARFFEPNMAPLPRHVCAALDHGPIAASLLASVEDAPSLLDEGDLATEDGYAVDRDGSLVVAVRTFMAGVSPAMWDWWFGWHGCDERRYKLWHPRAHLRATWADGPDAGRTGRARYVGRTSIVEEYLGSELVVGGIHFMAPAALGFDEQRLANAEQATAICARIGTGRRPAIDLGYLIHHVRATADGSEMRSRFWLGGRHVALPGAAGNQAAARALRPLVAHKLGDPERRGRALLVHCAQEMNHLAARLPALHDRFGRD